jgi:hypothetical protein
MRIVYSDLCLIICSCLRLACSGHAVGQHWVPGSARSGPDKSRGMQLSSTRGEGGRQGEAWGSPSARWLGRCLRGVDQRCSSAPRPPCRLRHRARQLTGAVVPSPRPARPGHVPGTCAAVKIAVSRGPARGLNIFVRSQALSFGQDFPEI